MVRLRRDLGIYFDVDANCRAILHDEKAYPEPRSFNPERFLKVDGSLNPEVRDPGVAAFGFGRRCIPKLSLYAHI